MVNLALVALMLLVTIGTKLVPDALPGPNTPVFSATLQLILEFVCLATSSYLTLVSTLFGKPPQPIGLSRLASYTLVSLQIVFLIAGLQNFTFNTQTKLALEGYEDAQISTDGTSLVLNGAIGANTYDYMVQEFNRTKPVRIVVNSPGGLIGEALEIAEFIKGRSISVYVFDVCASACVIIAAASPNLTASSKAKFGFHQGAALVVSENSLSKLTSLQATEVLLDALRGEGIPEEILDEAQKTAPGEMYFVTAQQLYDAGVVTSVGP